MVFRRFKSFTVAAFSLLFTLFFTPVLGQEDGGGHAGNEAVRKEGFNAKEVIFGHVLNSHEFHFFEIKQKDGSVYPISIPLPVILYS
ncbi:MAG: F0F1 ATP synthase subunit A, partial [Bacteroidia bacterium]|nr:F0F1 ATP synthase subunit A [Bacteroidia bacterium]